MPETAATARPPRFAPFGKYLLLERLAIGGMAEVYLAKSFAGARVSDLLAIKRILPSLVEDAEFIRMFLDEAKIAGQLRHPGIVQILELGRVGSSHYLAMDYVWGKDLLHVIRRCRLLGATLSPSFVAWVGASMCEALHYAHEKKDPKGRPMRIIHRDVSPQNVLVSFDGQVKIIDFGIAKAQSRSTRTQAGVLKGKVGYMSPEQVRGETIDHRSDLFAVGTCLYELLTLRSLFARENSYEAMENVRHVRARPVRELRADVPAELERILTQALSADPADRFQSAREMQGALIRFSNLEDPGYDRVQAVTWLRDAFRKELRAEKVRLDALDQLGRPQVEPADAPARTSITDLQIRGVGEPETPELEEEAPAVVFDEPIPFVDSQPPEQGPAEVFFSSQEIPRIDVERAKEWSAPGEVGASGEDVEVSRPAHVPPTPDAMGDDPLDDAAPTTRVHADGTPAPSTPEAPPAHIPAEGDVSIDPMQIHSGVIRQLLPPTEEPNDDARAQAAREPTARQRHDRSRPIGPPKKKSGALGKVLMALALLATGAIGAFAWTELRPSSGSLAVRTQPEVGAIVLVDGVQRGEAPLELESVSAGHHVVTVVADGFEDAHRDVDVDGDGQLVVEIALTPSAP